MAFPYHVVVRVSDFERGRKFYDGMFERLGWKTHADSDDAKAWSYGTFDFWLVQGDGLVPKEGKEHPGFEHLALRVEAKEEVDAFYSWLLTQPVSVDIAPKAYPEYSDTYYAVFFFDPEGTRLEVVFA